VFLLPILYVVVRVVRVAPVGHAQDLAHRAQAGEVL